jgi:blue copper oxidase
MVSAAAALGATVSGCVEPRRESTAASGVARAAQMTPDPSRFTTPLRLPSADGGFLGILDVPPGPFTLTARPRQLDLLPGKQTDVWAYESQLNGRTYLNPILRVPTGGRVQARLDNRLDEPTIVHWHGLLVDHANDGHPEDAVGPGGAYNYDFAVLNRGGTYWYHPHPDMRTAEQAYHGLAGIVIVEDDDEARLRAALDLELGVTDIPLVIQDRQFDAQGKLCYAITPMEQVMGFIGDRILVNGTAEPVLAVDARTYRFRVLNGSNARTYRLAFAGDGGPLPVTLIGGDGGLRATPASAPDVFVSPGERVDLLLDLGGAAAGDTVWLTSLAFDPMHNEMPGMAGGRGPGMGRGMGAGMGMDSSSTLADGAEFPVLKLDVRRRTAYDLRVPATLSSIAPIDTAGARSRPLRLSLAMMQWLINGRQFVMGEDAFSVRRDTTEVWEFTNVDQSMPHPMHLHGFLFQVVERRRGPRQIAERAVDATGRIATDLAWKDTVLIWPGEVVRVALRFDLPFTGPQRYLLHCHILEHEDQGMMLNWRVE